MPRSTVYLRPPAPPRPKRAAPKTARQELGSALFKYRAQLAPFMIAFWLVALALLFGPTRYRWLIVPALAGLGWYLYQDRYPVPKLRLERQVERRYAAACTGTAAAWYLCTTWAGTKPDAQGLVLLLILTCACATPWWHHRRVRGSIPVRFDDLTTAERAIHLAQARKLVQEWGAFTSAGHIQGAKIRGVSFNRWSVVLSVQLRRGATVGEFTVRRLEKLESAFGEVKAGSARVERVDRSARLASIRFMIEDPHAEPITPPDSSSASLDELFLGLFETGERILFRLVNTMIAGCTGSGKSGVINMIIRALARIPQVAIVGIDMKPGAPELGPWRKVMHTLATNAEEAADVLDRIREGLAYRGDLMARNGWRTWRPTRTQPFIVIIVDEVQELKNARLSGKLDKIAAIIRAYGGCVVVATQYPTKDNLPTTLKSNCPQKVGLRVEDPAADRVIFGEGATRSGWRPSTISTDREGSLMIKSPVYKKPLLGRAYWTEEGDVEVEAERWAGVRTTIDDATWDPVTTGVSAGLPAVAAPSLVKDDVVDAVLVDDDPRERVLAALRRGRSKVTEIAQDADISRASAYRHLAALAEQGLASSPSRGVWEAEDSSQFVS